MSFKVRVAVDVNDLVRITETHGGYHAGHCVLCKSYGWITEYRYGLPIHSRSGTTDVLKHNVGCKFNRILTTTGRLTRKP